MEAMKLAAGIIRERMSFLAETRDLLRFQFSGSRETAASYNSKTWLGTVRVGSEIASSSKITYSLFELAGEENPLSCLLLTRPNISSEG